MVKNICVLCVSLVLLASCASKDDMSPIQDQSAPASQDKVAILSSMSYTLGAGDVVRVNVFGDTQLSGEFTVDASGHFSMPLIQDIAAAGYTAIELEKIITDKLQPEYMNDPKVSVQVIEYRSVYILGEVRLPGKYPYVPNMTLLQAIAVAGGHTYRADENGADISRQINGEIKKFKIRPEGYIMPGDTVVIDRRWF